jgi:energy-coupling factor transport system substrate-specific component
MRAANKPGPVGLDLFGSLAIATASAVGAVAFLWPLFIPARASVNQAHAGDAPWVVAVLLPLLLVAVLGEFSSGGMDAKGVAMLGVLGACGAALRLPSGGAAGFEPVFFLLFPAGYVLGRHFGFLLGALTLFASALVTGGVGPWLPFQMMAAAWMGYGAGWLPHLKGRRELAVLAAYAAVACFAYGALMDLWFWPFGAGTSSSGAQRGSDARWRPAGAGCLAPSKPPRRVRRRSRDRASTFGETDRQLTPCSSVGPSSI